VIWVLAFHVVFVFAWFGGLAYLPHLFYYHAIALSDNAEDAANRYTQMERRLFYIITTPAGVISTVLGCIVLFDRADFYFSQPWMWVKLIFALIVWIYHLYCGVCLTSIAHGKRLHSPKFYRSLHQIPVISMVIIVIMAVVKP